MERTFCTVVCKPACPAASLQEFVTYWLSCFPSGYSDSVGVGSRNWWFCGSSDADSHLAVGTTDLLCAGAQIGKYSHFLLPLSFLAVAEVPWHASCAVPSLASYCTPAGFPVQSGAVDGSDPCVASVTCAAACTLALGWTRHAGLAWHAPSPSGSSFYLVPILRNKR